MCLNNIPSSVTMIAQPLSMNLVIVSLRFKLDEVKSLTKVFFFNFSSDLFRYHSFVFGIRSGPSARSGDHRQTNSDSNYDDDDIRG